MAREIYGCILKTMMKGRWEEKGGSVFFQRVEEVISMAEPGQVTSMDLANKLVIFSLSHK